jgi:hypothetical protein
MNVSSIASQASLHSLTNETASVHAPIAQELNRTRRVAKPPPEDPQKPAPPAKDPSQSTDNQPTRTYLGPISQDVPKKGTHHVPVKVWLATRRRKKKKDPLPGSGASPVTPRLPKRPAPPAVSPTGGGNITSSQGTAILINTDLRVKQGTVTLKRLQSEGPLNLEPADGVAADIARINQFGKPLVFYRNDKSVSGMRGPTLIDRTDYPARRDIITLGKGEDATSYVHEAKAYMGRAWASTPTELSGTDIVKLGAGKDGVAVIKLPFKQLRPGSTVIVTGGAMRGSTMLFAADSHGFYAYHAGSTSDNLRWTVSEDGARSIANAYRRMRSSQKAWITARSAAEELVSIAHLHPFSALIYNGEYSTEAGRKPFDERIRTPTHATGTDPAHPWHMMTFSYFEPGDVRTVGTAEAVISKDASGKVTVQLLGEKGKLDHMQTTDLRGGSVGFRYRSIEGATTSYTVAASKQR